MYFGWFKSAFSITSAEKKLFRSIRNLLGYSPGNLYLYQLAFQSKSIKQEPSNGPRINNERLEFLGDAILDAVTADYLFRLYPTRDEGFLTEMRSKMVNRNQLNKLSVRMGIDALISIDPASTPFLRSFHGNALEALIGAIYLDKGYNFAKKIIIERIIERFFDMDELVKQEVNFKSRILEWAQREKHQIRYDVIDEIETGYRKQYVVELIVNSKTLSRGIDYSIKGAEQNASEKAWQKIIGEKS